MVCASCSSPLEPAARFCPLCGTARPVQAIPPPFAGAAFVSTGRLCRPRSPRMIAGVCAGLAAHYGWDLTLVRLVTAMLALFTGVFGLVYLAAWIIIPEAQYALARPPMGAGSLPR